MLLQQVIYLGEIRTSAIQIDWNDGSWQGLASCNASVNLIADEPDINGPRLRLDIEENGYSPKMSDGIGRRYECESRDPNFVLGAHSK
jgi:hypothetical protein